MKISYSNLWDSKADLYVVTCNGTLNRYGELVMGRGAALEAKNRFPELPLLAGQIVRKNFKKDIIYKEFYRYGFFCIGNLGLFQVKYHFKDKADIELIKYSAICLYNYLDETDFNLNVHMNYPAIGYGGLKREDVEPIIQTILPDNVTVHIMKDYQ